MTDAVRSGLGCGIGTISIGGRIVNDVLPKDRDIAMVFQSYALYPHMSVAENMGFSLKMQRFAREDASARVERAATILGLDQLLARYPRHLSGGQRQRVAMGRAIVRDPSVFLFDEPLSNLDAKLRVQMRSEIKALHQRLETTTVYVTHDQIEAMTMADRVVVMHDGIVEQIGTPLELYDSPQNLFVAEFIGSPAINLLPGRLTGEGFLVDDQIRLPAAAGCRVGQEAEGEAGRVEPLERLEVGEAERLLGGGRPRRHRDRHEGVAPLERECRMPLDRRPERHALGQIGELVGQVDRQLHRAPEIQFLAAVAVNQRRTHGISLPCPNVGNSGRHDAKRQRSSG